MINLTNFYVTTFAKFKRCNVPKRKPNFVSLNKKNGKPSSKYWYGEDKEGEYVIRLSDHWGDVASCRWLLDGSTENYDNPQCGKAYCSAFR